MHRKTVIALGGDGIGPELVDTACNLLEKAGFPLTIVKPLHGEVALKRYGTAFPEETKRLCDEAGVVLFGITRGTCNPIVSYLRYVCDNYVDLRPIKFYPGAKSCLKDPTGIDFLILRENSEGLYPPREGDISLLVKACPTIGTGNRAKHSPIMARGSLPIRIISERGVKRLASYACDCAMERKKSGHPGKITCASKSNMFEESCGLFARIVEEEVRKHAGTHLRALLHR